MKLLSYIILSVGVLLIAGCSSNEVAKKDLLFIPGISDSVNLTEIDPGFWLGPIQNEKGDSIGSVAVNPKSKKAFVKTKIDTVEVPVPEYVKKYETIEKIIDLLPWWAKLLYGLVIGLTTAVLTYFYMRFNRGK